MCGRYVFTPNSDFFSRFDVVNSIDDELLAPNYNVTPGQNLPVIIRQESQNLVSPMVWGLIPFWAKDPSIGARLINARSESVSQKPSFRRSFKHHRCLVPSNGFYEWKSTPNRPKQPYYFYLKDQSLFSFAGLYDIWTDTFGREIYTYTIITTKANRDVSPVHDRMPAIISPDDESAWLSSSSTDTDLNQLLAPLPSGLINSHPVTAKLNRLPPDSPDIIKPIA